MLNLHFIFPLQKFTKACVEVGQLAFNSSCSGEMYVMMHAVCMLKEVRLQI